MAGNISDERTELQEDDEKFQSILHEFGTEWGYVSSDEEEVEEDDDQLLIDLEYENETSDTELNEVVRSFSKSDSISRSFQGSGSRSHSITAADEESGEIVPRPSLELPSQVDVAEYRADPLKTLHLNRVLQGILEDHISAIKTALQENKEKQSKLEEDASDLAVKPEKKGIYAGVFRAPFFRHVHSFPPPNEDMVLKKSSGDYDIVTPDSVRDLRYFNKSAKLLLRDAVYEDCLERALKPLVSRMEIEIQKRDKFVDDYEIMCCKLDTEKRQLNEFLRSDDKADCEEMIEEVKNTIQELKNNLAEKSKAIKARKDEIARLERLIQDKKNTPEDEILATADPEKVDWMKISKSHFTGHSTWLDCQKAWENLVSPSINTGAWTKEEEKQLIDLFKQSPANDWKQIATDLGTGRTAFQCFSHYQQKFNSALKPRPWTKAEDETLVRVTNNVKDSVGFFNWAKISTLVDSRSPVECMYRFTRVDPCQARGRFTQLEDAKLLAAVEMIGPSWSKVAKFIGSRNMVQCRDRYLNCLAPNINFSHFTYDEDVKLLKLRKQYGQTWSKMVPEFVGRTDGMLLNRFRQLQRWKRQSEWFDRQPESTKRMLLGKSLTVAERRQFRDKIDIYMKTQLGLGPEDYKRQELDRQNHIDPDIIPPRPPRHLRCYSYGTSRKGANLSKWSEKLDIHKRLTENLQKLLKKEILAGVGDRKGEGRPAVSEEMTAEIVQKSAEETLKGNTKIRHKIKNKKQLKQLEAALNKAFLTSGNVSVQEFLKLSTLQKRKARNFEKSHEVDAELKSILRTRSRSMSKLGRARRFFEKDPRSKRVIEEELDECDRLVPSMLMKFLGTSVHSLCTFARYHCLDHQEELSNLPSYEEDPDFQEEEAETQKAIQNLATKPDGSVSNWQLRIFKKKLKTLRKIYKEKMHLKSKVVENKISAFNEDTEFLESLTEEEGVLGKNISLMICNPAGISETAFNAEIVETGSQTVSTTSSSDVQISVAKSELIQGQSCQEDTGGQSTSSASNSDHKFAVPLAPPIKQSKRRSSRLQSDTDEPARKVFKILSKEEIIAERNRLPSSKKKMFTRLPLLPPNLSTLSGLRGLFLMKDELKERTQRIQKERYEATHPHEATTSDEIPKNEDDPIIVGEDEPLVEDTASWFLNTNIDQLGEQASKFKPYCRLGKVPHPQTKSKHHFQTVGETLLHSTARTNEEDLFAFETGTLLYPLEEKGGHLPNFTNRRILDCYNKEKPDCYNEEKPVAVCRTRKSPIKQRGKYASHYEVVVGFTGSQANEENTNKQTNKKSNPGSSNPSLTQSNFPLLHKAGKDLSVVPVTRNNLSILPGTTDNPSQIKNEPATTTLSYNICNESRSERIQTVAGSNWGVSVQGSSITRPDNIYSVRTLDRSEPNIDDDSDVVAVIHLDDDASSAPTVINICSSQTDTMKTEIVEGRDEESVIFSENVRPSQFMIIPPEPAKAVVSKMAEVKKREDLSELGSLELPENCVSSIMRNKRLEKCKNRIVVVGVDEESGKIVHFKAEDDKFKAFEAIPTSVAEDNVGRPRGVPARSDSRNTNKSFNIVECIRGLRKTDEYKLLFARFRSLFMWPVFMSTMKPSPLIGGPFPSRLRYTKPVNSKLTEMTKKKKKRPGTKMTVSKREQLRLINQARLKKASSGKTGKQVKIKNNVDADAGINVEQQVTEPGLDTEVSSGQENSSATQAESTGQGEVNTALVKDEQNPDAAKEKPAVDSEDSTETVGRIKGKGRPKGSKNTKYEPLPNKRSLRIRKKVTEEAPPAEPAKDFIRVLPQWWKDAVLAAMLAKKAIAEGHEENLEVRIDEDDEFLDKGNYSDDEWYQQLRADEIKKAEMKNRKEVGEADVLLTSQEVATEDNVLLE